MITSKSPRKVLALAHELAQQVLAPFASRFSRKDYTAAQLFACLVLREHQRKSFRGVEALLSDSPSWLADIGLGKAPDHNTLCRAFDRFMKPRLARSMLDLMARLARQRKTLKHRRHKPLAIDSSMYESRHVSRHFESRRRDGGRQGHKKKAWILGKMRQSRPSPRRAGTPQALAGVRRHHAPDPLGHRQQRPVRRSTVL
jgi:hypothetical protein